MTRTSPGVPLNFIISNLSHDGDDCLFWPFASYSNGYGHLKYEGREWVASRLMCQMAHGPAPTPEHEAAHSCGRGGDGCIHPKHLSWKTRLDNQRDRIGHGTSNRGSTNGQATLTESEVSKIVARLNAGDRQQSIADNFGVTQTAISQINLGKKWGWLTGRRATP